MIRTLHDVWLNVRRIEGRMLSHARKELNGSIRDNDAVHAHVSSDVLFAP
jgi:hypothetical protein